MLELLNQLDGFDTRGDVKVIMATNKIESLDPALIRPGRIDRKIEFPLPDVRTKRHIFRLHTSRMSLSEDVDLEEFIMTKDDLSGADIKAVCTEAGLLALRERRMRVTKADFTTAREKVGIRKACCRLSLTCIFFRCCIARTRGHQRGCTCKSIIVIIHSCYLFTRCGAEHKRMD
jgi:26S proteasome regulatory subunit T2